MLKLPSLRAFHLHPAPGHQHPGQLPLPAFAKIKVSRAGLAAPHPAGSLLTSSFPQGAQPHPLFSSNSCSAAPGQSARPACSGLSPALPFRDHSSTPACAHALPCPAGDTFPSSTAHPSPGSMYIWFCRTPHRGGHSITHPFLWLSVCGLHVATPSCALAQPLPSPHTEVPACQGSAHLSRDPIPPGCARRVSLRLAGCC